MGTLSQTLREYVAGCFTGVWIESREPQEAITGDCRLCRERIVAFGAWNIDQGLRAGSESAPRVMIRWRPSKQQVHLAVRKRPSWCWRISTDS